MASQRINSVRLDMAKEVCSRGYRLANGINSRQTRSSPAVWIHGWKPNLRYKLMAGSRAVEVVRYTRSCLSSRSRPQIADNKAFPNPRP